MFGIPVYKLHPLVQERQITVCDVPSGMLTATTLLATMRAHSRLLTANDKLRIDLCKFRGCNQHTVVKEINDYDNNSQEIDIDSTDSAYWKKVCQTSTKVFGLRKVWDKVESKVNWSALCQNPHAMALLDWCWDEVYGKRKLSWYQLCKNPNIMFLFLKHWKDARQRVNFMDLAQHPDPAVIPLVKKHIKASKFNPSTPERRVSVNPYRACNPTSGVATHERVNSHQIKCLQALCCNPNAIPVLEKYWRLLDAYTELQYEDENYVGNRINWDGLAANPNLMQLIHKRLISGDYMASKLRFHMDKLCKNPGAIEFLEHNWQAIKRNPNIETHIQHMCRNPNIMPFFEKHWDDVKEHIDWSVLSANMATDVLDYAAMRNNARHLAEELATKVFHPSRMDIWSKYEADDDETEEKA